MKTKTKILIIFFSVFSVFSVVNNTANAQRSFSIGNTILADSSGHLLLKGSNFVITKDTVIIGQQNGSGRLMISRVASEWTINQQIIFTGGLKTGAEIWMEGNYLYTSTDPQSYIAEEVPGTREHNIPAAGTHDFYVDGTLRLQVNEDGTKPARLLGTEVAATNTAGLLTFGAGNYTHYSDGTAIEFIDRTGWTHGSIVTIYNHAAADLVDDASPSVAAEVPLLLLGYTSYSPPGRTIHQFVYDSVLVKWIEISRIEF